ncbi:MAG: T9SS type A sorting domain-containing protein [Melioribacteraceae bacterium]|nr:T9SS type A sorting domain-containing protein [Melioribacteraceae bacterium]
MKKIFFLQILFLFSSLAAQTDTLKEALKFYPLHIGDYWQYNVNKHSDGPYKPDTSWVGYKEVIGDTVMDNNKKYFIIKNNKIPFLYGYNIETRFLRVDSSTALVYEYINSIKSEIKIDSLLSQKGDVYLGRICASDTIKDYFGHQVSTKLIKQNLISSTSYSGWELAKGFGEVMRYYDDIFVYSILTQGDLIYAIINGIEYGIKNDIQKSEVLPNEIILNQNYPNPFNPSTTISYSIPSTQHVMIGLFDILGKKISTLVDEEKLAGTYHLIFDGTKLASGVYLYELLSGSTNISKKMILIK